MKQETLEEVAKNKYGSSYGSIYSVNAFIDGAKWQQERMYSDMQEYAEFCIVCYQAELPCILAKDWFEQFKKKEQ